MSGTVHIIGAGLAGLSAAVRLAANGERIVLHEATNVAGGRCRSYHDPQLDMMIDNGNHLVLSGNQATVDYVWAIGAQDRLVGPAHAEFPFIDLATMERWTLRMNDGRIPWWIFNKSRRAPGTRPRDYFKLLRLMRARPGQTVGEVMDCSGIAYDRVVAPLLIAALNTEPPQGSAALAGAVIRETLAAGGRKCRPMIALHGLGSALIDPALDFLRGRNATLHFGRRLQSIDHGEGRARMLDFGDAMIPLGSSDAVVVAVPPTVAPGLVPCTKAPTEFRAIVNAHFRVDPPDGQPPLMGLVNGAAEWIFAFPGRLSVTISAGDRFLDTPREVLAQTIWRDVAAVTGLPWQAPKWQIVRERRATFAATPAQNALRPRPATVWRNVFLAGDWTDTGLPATIEGAIRSGNRAAELVERLFRKS